MIAGMQDYKVSRVRKAPTEDRMKAILKGHARLPLALLFVSGARLGHDKLSTRWAPAFPQGNRLDHSLGYLKVFCDCLLVRNENRKTTQDSEPVKNPLQWILARSQALNRWRPKPEPLPTEYSCLIVSSDAKLYSHFTLKVQCRSGLEKVLIEIIHIPDSLPIEASTEAAEGMMTCILLPNFDSLENNADWY